MNPTPESLEQTAAAMRAHLEGKPWQLRRIGEPDWANPGPGQIILPRCFDIWEYRPKPEPATVPWDCADDVPGPVIWVGQLDEDKAWDHCGSMVIAISPEGITALDFTDNITAHSWKELEQMEMHWSIDRKSWHPCTKEAKA